MKALKPSARENKRYLFVRGKNLKEDVEKSLVDFLGILGFSKLGLNWIKLGKDFGILAINREMLDLVRASFCVWPEKIEVEKVSGTLKSLK